MKYLFLVMVGAFLLSIVGGFTGLVLSLDFSKWAKWICLLPYCVAVATAFVMLCLFVKKEF